MAIKAMILAAGKGTRVQPLTYDMPKPMIPVLGKPVMEYIVEHLARHGVRELMVNLSHLGYRIEQYFGDGSRHGVHMGYSFEGYLENDQIVPSPVGSAGALRKIQDFGGFFDDTTVVLCGDAIIDVDLTAAIAEHRAKRALVSVVAKEVPWESVPSYGVIEPDAGGRIISFQEKPSPAEARSNWASTGIYIFEPEAIQLIPRGRAFDIGGELFPRLAQRGVPFFMQKHAFNWIDIGKVSDYWSVVTQLMTQPVAGVRIPGCERLPGVHTGLNTRIDFDKVRIRGPVYIGSGTYVEDGAEIVGPAWIGHGCHIQSDARIERCVLLEYAHVGRAARLSEMIVSGRYCVDRSGKTLLRSEAGADRSWGDARRRDRFAVAA